MRYVDVPCRCSSAVTSFCVSQSIKIQPYMAAIKLALLFKDRTGIIRANLRLLMHSGYQAAILSGEYGTLLALGTYRQDGGRRGQTPSPPPSR